MPKHRLTQCLKNISQGTATLEYDADGKPTEQSAELATVSVLIDLALVDNRLAAEEVTALLRSLQRLLGSSADEALNQLEEAERIRERPDHLHRVLEEIDRRFNSLQKQSIMENIWQIILADGHVHLNEQRFALALSEKLKLLPEQVAQARAYAEQEVRKLEGVVDEGSKHEDGR